MRFMQIVCALLLFLFPSSMSGGEKEPYERFISLGNCCATRTQINSHLSKRFGLHHSSFGGGQLFDWMVIHNYHKLIEALNNNLEDLFEKHDLVVANPWSPDYQCVVNVRYQMTWNHLFSRNIDGSLDDNIIDVEYDLRKQKIDYLSDKFRSLSKYRTLYILCYPMIGSYHNSHNTLEPDKITLILLKETLKRFRGNDNFDILYCPIKQKFSALGIIYIHPIVNPPDVTLITQGDFACWDKILSQFPFTINEHGGFDDDLKDP